MSTSRLEMETIINYNEDEDIAEVYTASRRIMRKLDRMCERFPATYSCVKRSEHQATYSIPKDRIRFLAPPSEARRQAGREKALKHGFKRSSLTASGE